MTTKSKKENEVFLSASEAVKYCKEKYNVTINEQSIYDATNRNRIPKYKPFGNLRIKASDLDAYVESTSNRNRLC